MRLVLSKILASLEEVSIKYIVCKNNRYETPHDTNFIYPALCGAI